MKRRSSMKMETCMLIQKTMLNYDSGDVRRELLALSIDDYIENMKDDRHPDTPDFRVFGKTLNGFQIYIKEKIRSTKGVFAFHFIVQDII